MLNFKQYINENLGISLDLILEANKKIWPLRQPDGSYKFTPISIMIGDHVEDRKSERKVTNDEIVNAVMGAKKDIKQLLKDGALKVASYKDKKQYTFVITDARKNREHPLTVVGFVSWSDSKFKKCNVVIKTVGKYSNFSSTMRKDSEYEKHIQLY